MENYIQCFRTGLILVGPHDSVVKIKPRSSTNGVHKVPNSTTTHTKQSSTSSYKCVSNKNRRKIEAKKTNSSSTTTKVQVTGHGNTKGKSVKKIGPRGGNGIKEPPHHGKVACKTEYKTSTSVKIKDRNGYTKYKKQEQFTRVEYKKSGRGSALK